MDCSPRNSSLQDFPSTCSVIMLLHLIIYSRNPIPHSLFHHRRRAIRSSSSSPVHRLHCRSSHPLLPSTYPITAHTLLSSRTPPSPVPSKPQTPETLPKDPTSSLNRQIRTSTTHKTLSSPNSTLRFAIRFRPHTPTNFINARSQISRTRNARDREIRHAIGFARLLTPSAGVRV
jgi:hypothetical protein